jgi:hypothetical protein
MKRPVRQEDGTYKVKGKTYKELFGSRAQVYNKTAYKTSGGLTSGDLMMNKHGRIVSRRKAALGKKALKNLVKAGYKPTRGKFKLFSKK